MMLLMLLCLFPLAGCRRAAMHNILFKGKVDRESVAMATRPYIYKCRSPNMEDFTCWWLPLENLTDREEASYILTYSIEKGPVQECPDYTSAGSHSCHFDKSHTSVWKIYCMNVTAVTTYRNYTSLQHCVDVADIVQTEAPVNLTHTIADAGGDETGHKINLTWQYPVPSHLQYGWITLVYELQYRREAEPDNWKVQYNENLVNSGSTPGLYILLLSLSLFFFALPQVKYPLSEPHVQLLGLPVDNYVVRVRCRSQNYGLWSNWSSSNLMTIPSKTATGKLLILSLLTSVSVVVLLLIGAGVAPQSKRLKDFLLPPIPKPKIIGIDPLLLKKGQLDEINRHLSNFHSYKPPSYKEEMWEQISTDSIYVSTLKDISPLTDSSPKEQEDSFVVPCEVKPVAASLQFPTKNPTSYVQSLPHYGPTPPEGYAPSMKSDLSPLPNYNRLEPDNSLTPHSITAMQTPGDFYTCVQYVKGCQEMHLVPFMTTPYHAAFPPLLSGNVDPVKIDEEEKERKVIFAEYQARNDGKDGREAERSEAAVPLLAGSTDIIS
uniref:Growth hormone/erythropoietin receptor ligand binding domain-containing protein n=1 Tax=Cynoglossus semilaevis TaxID=244447 RepID=A0A3P8VMG2_CYNSE